MPSESPEITAITPPSHPSLTESTYDALIVQLETEGPDLLPPLSTTKIERLCGFSNVKLLTQLVAAERRSRAASVPDEAADLALTTVIIMHQMLRDEYLKRKVEDFSPPSPEGVTDIAPLGSRLSKKRRKQVAEAVAAVIYPVDMLREVARTNLDTLDT